MKARSDGMSYLSLSDKQEKGTEEIMQFRQQFTQIKPITMILGIKERNLFSKL